MCDVSHHLIKEFENIEKDELIRMYNSLVNRLLEVTQQPETELESWFLQTLKENGKTPKWILSLEFERSKYADGNNDFDTVFSSLLVKGLIVPDGLSYSVKEQ